MTARRRRPGSAPSQPPACAVAGRSVSTGFVIAAPMTGRSPPAAPMATAIPARPAVLIDQWMPAQLPMSKALSSEWDPGPSALMA